MAETAVSLVIQNLAQKVGLLKDVHKEVESIKDELGFIQCFLEDVDAKAEMEGMNNVAKLWVKKVREVAYRIEDVIEEYILHLPNRSHKLLGYFPINLKRKCDIASEIQDIKNTLNEIRQKAERYNFNHSSEQGALSSDTTSVTGHDPRITSHFLEEDEVVGIKYPRDFLIGWLMEGEPKRMVMSVVGIGGIGKTTLVKKVYDDERLIGKFDCHAWITVSQSYKVEEILRDMIKQFCEAMKESTHMELDTKNGMLLMGDLKEILKQKRYVVVFDDIWKTEFWRQIKYALPDNGECSRIIITTRNEDVAPSINESPLYHVYKLLPLTSNIAWELFCKKVFQSEQERCPVDLLELSRGILNKCGGLPLAIALIGGLLSTKDKVVSEWRIFHDSLGSELQTNRDLEHIKRILSLSYHDLPYNLKSCFLYFGMFPEDYFIDCGRLFRLWIAEGFVKETQGLILEEVAEGYLKKLIHRNLVQVAKVNVDGKVSSCRVHDMMREVILSRSEELSFCHVSMNHNSSFDGIARRLSIRNDINTVSESITSSQTRSILVFSASEFSKDLVIALLTNLKLVKTLDFEGVPIDYIPEEMGNLFHLKYLNLKKTKVKILPKSIGKLHNLETLDLRLSLVSELPAEISELRMLRYLYTGTADYDKNLSMDRYRAVKIQSGIGHLELLLSLLDVEANCASIVEELGRLRQLRTLGISKLKRENGMALCTALVNMCNLQRLRVVSTNEDEYLELQSLSSPSVPLLQSLVLYGRLEKLPEWIFKLKSVVQICLGWSRLMEDPLKVLQALPNLMELSLYDAYVDEQLHFEEGGFQKLKILDLQNFEVLNKLMIEEGALPLLAELVIGNSPQLKELPTNVHHLKSLKFLRFLEMPREFVLSLQPNEGQDFWKVKHIPTIFFNYRIKGERYKTYKVGDPNLLACLKGDS